MDLPRRFEQVGTVVGSVLLLTLPMSILAVFIDFAPYWLDAFVTYVPGLVIGVFVALFGWLTLIGGGIVGSLTGTKSVQPLVLTLAKWFVAMLFAFLIVRYQLDKNSARRYPIARNERNRTRRVRPVRLPSIPPGPIRESGCRRRTPREFR